VVQSGDSSIKRSQFRLAGPQISSDNRVTAIRGDLADIGLAGSHFAPHYAQSKHAHCIVPSAIISASPDDVAVTQISYGEKFAILDISGKHAWGYCLHDNYVGYIKTDVLSQTPLSATHQISSRGALIFSETSIKSPVITRLPMGSQITAQESNADSFMQVDGGYIHKRHISPIGQSPYDSIDLARELIGAPYLWGGRNGDALDCSGLVQLILGLKGIEAPRDSDMQQAIGQEISEDASLQRGDIIFFSGHVGIMSDETHIIHANAHWMQVKEETLIDVVNRIEDGGITARRRL